MYPIYVLIALLPPVAMLIVGIWWKVSPPKMEGKGLAYRTQLSTKSPEAWAFAHKHCARLWVRMGVILTAAAASPCTCCGTRTTRPSSSGSSRARWLCSASPPSWWTPC